MRWDLKYDWKNKQHFNMWAEGKIKETEMEKQGF